MNFAFNAALRFVLNHDPRTLDDVPVQFGLAGAVAAHGVEVHPGLDHLRRQNRCVGLVGRDRGHDIGTTHRLRDGFGNGHLNGGVGPQVGYQLRRCGRIDVVETDFSNAEQCMKCQGLEFAL
ncbi:hypothetical protein D3C87_1532590 [compost metagenome]